MRKLNLRDYQYTKKVATPENEIIEATLPYMVKDSILEIMFGAALQLRGAELVKQNVLAIKIEQVQQPEDDDAEYVVMLEDAEYDRIVDAADAYPAKSRADVEMIDRILNQTPKIE